MYEIYNRLLRSIVLDANKNKILISFSRRFPNFTQVTGESKEIFPIQQNKKNSKNLVRAK